jgi:hypothetical protein
MSIDELRWENAHLQEELAELREELGLHCAGYEHRIQRRRELLAEIEQTPWRARLKPRVPRAAP